MECQPIKQYRPLFKGRPCVLKILWRKGELPQVTNGIYGDKLTQENLSLEHIVPKCKGGKTELANLALATKKMNNLRNARRITEYITWDNIDIYCKQFKGIRKKEFSGERYVKILKQTLRRVFDKNKERHNGN